MLCKRHGHVEVETGLYALNPTFFPFQTIAHSFEWYYPYPIAYPWFNSFSSPHLFPAAVVTTYGYYAAVFVPRREAYRKFYENYDPDKTYEQMKKTGIFQSVAQIAEAAAEAEEEAAGGEEDEE